MSLRYRTYFRTSCPGLALLSAVLLSGCSLFDPAGETLVEGQVVERTSRQPVPDAELYLIRSGGASGGGSYLPDVYHADAQGKFRFRFSGEEGQEYQLDAKAAPGYYTNHMERPDLRGGRRNKDVSVPVSAPAWVRIHLRDEPPRTLARVYVSGYFGQDREFYHPRDTTYVRQVYPDFPTTIYGRVTLDSGGETSQRHPINPGPLDTVTVTIRF